MKTREVGRADTSKNKRERQNSEISYILAIRVGCARLKIPSAPSHHPTTHKKCGAFACRRPFSWAKHLCGQR